METMQKNKMWKVTIIAIAHFSLTLFVLMKLGFPLIGASSHAREIWLNGLGGFWLKFVWLLHPQFFLLGVINVYLKKIIPFTFSSPFFILAAISIPLWSICFGWLCVKFTNWLNHFSHSRQKSFLKS
jgi:hypothetical protein